MFTLLLALLLIVVLMVSWLLTLLGMPGNWLMVAATATYAWLVPAGARGALGWKIVVTLIVLAAAGECVELLAGALGVAKAGGSRRAAVLALLGSIVGAVLGVFIGAPVPLVGSVVAAVFFGGLGAMAGATLGETWAGRDPSTRWRIARSAFWGRLAGTLSKMLLGAIMVAVVVAALVWSWL